MQQAARCSAVSVRWPACLACRPPESAQAPISWPYVGCRLIENDEGTAVRPYLMDLGSTNGTFLNDERLEPQRYYELLEKVRFLLYI